MWLVMIGCQTSDSFRTHQLISLFSSYGQRSNNKVNLVIKLHKYLLKKIYLVQWMQSITEVVLFVIHPGSGWDGPHRAPTHRRPAYYRLRPVYDTGTKRQTPEVTGHEVCMTATCMAPPHVLCWVAAALPCGRWIGGKSKDPWMVEQTGGY